MPESRACESFGIVEFNQGSARPPAPRQGAPGIPPRRNAVLEFLFQSFAARATKAQVTLFLFLAGCAWESLSKSGRFREWDCSVNFHTHVKVHADGSNLAGGQAPQAMGRTKVG